MNPLDETVAQYYPALRRLLKLGIAVVAFHAGNGSIEHCYEIAAKFLMVFDSERRK